MLQWRQGELHRREAEAVGVVSPRHYPVCLGLLAPYRVLVGPASQGSGAPVQHLLPPPPKFGAVPPCTCARGQHGIGDTVRCIGGD